MARVRFAFFASPIVISGMVVSGAVLLSAGCASLSTASAARSLAGLRIELACADHFNKDTECHWNRALEQPAGSRWKLRQEVSRTFAGDPGKTYEVTLRIRGVVEPKNFEGGEVRAEHFQIGGTPVVNDYNFYNIEVSEPQAVYTVNRSASKVGHYTFALDYTVTIPIRGGATVAITASDSNTVAIANHEKHVVPGIAPAPQPFDGQFFQVEVVGVGRGR